MIKIKGGKRRVPNHMIDHAIDVAFDFLRDNWNTVRNSYANYNVAFKKILNGILSRLTTKHDLDEVTIQYVCKYNSVNNKNVLYFRWYDSSLLGKMNYHILHPK